MPQILEIDSSSANELYDFSMDIFGKFIDNNLDEINGSLNGVESLEFTDYNTWTWIEPLISLKSRLNKGNEAIEQVCKNKILSVLEKGNDLQVKIKKRVFDRVLKGEELLDQLIEQYRQEGETDLEKEAIYKSIMQLVTIIEMGASEQFTIQDAESKLSQLLKTARSLS